MKSLEIKTHNSDPNFSIVMPGGCNAACSFCFNKSKKNQVDEIDQFEWIFGLQDYLKLLPDKFYQISITGNEPMISPIIDGVLSLCGRFKERYSNILLTTNGTNLLKKIDQVSAGVHHINISRHHFDEAVNMKIFGGQYHVTDEELIEIVDRYSAIGVDVSLNCVINDKTEYSFIMEYVGWANTIGVKAVRFRKQNGKNIDLTPVEKMIDRDYPILHRGQCPVCRTYHRVILGLDTYWKAAIIEPTDKIKDSVYELVYDVDGILYCDWNRNIPFDEFVGEQVKNMAKSHFEAYDNCGNIIDYNSCGFSLRGDHC